VDPEVDRLFHVLLPVGERHPLEQAILRDGHRLAGPAGALEVLERDHVVEVGLVHAGRVYILDTQQTLHEQRVVLLNVVDGDRLPDQQLPHKRGQWQC